MIFYRFFTFLFFLNLCNSFKIISHNNLINHKSNRIHMWCDYFIEHNLWIKYNDNMCSYINLNRERGYYYSEYGDYIISRMEEKSGMSEWEKMKEYHLTPKSVPQIIYSNNSFTNTDVLNQYKERIEIGMYHFKTWDDIKEIIILEERYLRE